MLIRLFLLLAAIPLCETILLLTLADKLGFLAAFAAVIGSGILGAWLLKNQGLRAVGRIREEFAAGRLPAAEVLDGVLIVAAGVLLITPGILTDTLGIVLLVPVSRSWVRRWLVHWVQSRWHLQAMGSTIRGRGAGTADQSQVVDSYVVRSTEQEPSS